MPYTRRGKAVYKKTDGLKKVGTSKSVRKAKAYKKTLEAIHHGWNPPRKGGRRGNKKR